jgi:hypothetical protein
MLLFAKRLDDAVPPNQCVRLLDELLGQLDWSPWEAKYHERLGQPAIHPRVLAGVLLYGAASVSDRSRTARHFPTLNQRATPSAIVATPIDVTSRDPRRHSAHRARQRAIPVATRILDCRQIDTCKILHCVWAFFRGFVRLQTFNYQKLTPFTPLPRSAK